MTNRMIDALTAEKVMGMEKNEFGEYRFALKLFEPSTNISDAWKVVEKLKETVAWVAVDWYENRTYRCCIKAYPDGIDSVLFAETSDTAPEAICLAALRAKGVDIE